MQTLYKERYPRRLDHVVWKVIDGKGILLNLENGAYFEADPVGLSIWQKCDGQTTLEEIAQSVAEEFQAEVERVSRDLSDFFTQLRRRRLVEIFPAPHVSRPLS